MGEAVRADGGDHVESRDLGQRSFHAAPGIVEASPRDAEAGALMLLDLRGAGAARATGSRMALRSLSSATLAVGSATAFLVLVTLLSFMPEDGGRDRTAEQPTEQPADNHAAHVAARLAARLAERSASWPLRGALQPPEVLPPPGGGVAQRAPS